MILTPMDLIDMMNKYSKEICGQMSRGDLLATEISHHFEMWAMGRDGGSPELTKIKLEEWLKREGKDEAQADSE